MDEKNEKGMTERCRYTEWVKQRQDTERRKLEREKEKEREMAIPDREGPVLVFLELSSVVQSSKSADGKRKEEVEGRTFLSREEGREKIREG